ncbi:hypothetical protein [Oleiagrimonas sp. C23AA]|uniref:hypothetical protein n=1 Tax=Oleiagrimonas sp. C23AA TaxID=2719047 RepID=UPI00141F6B93|nr:hypothetical protein [Oleiagrimonas sp. C23AA]NII11038.1 hypothetical protein [Oleiagrimonas sp. C23AA]
MLSDERWDNPLIPYINAGQMEFFLWLKGGELKYEVLGGLVFGTPKTRWPSRHWGGGGVLTVTLRSHRRLDQEQRNVRVFGPDETLSNGLGALFEATQRQWDAATRPDDKFLAGSGRVVDSMLSEYQREGWIERTLQSANLLMRS